MCYVNANLIKSTAAIEKELYEHESQKLGILMLIAKLVLPI